MIETKTVCAFNGRAFGTFGAREGAQGGVSKKLSQSNDSLGRAGEGAA